MTWENRDLWHIDHRIPINYKNPETNEKPTLEQVIERLHWSNTKPMWAKDNIQKGNKYID